MSISRVPQLVRVMTTARLHMGFMDLHGGLGRRFGSIGLSLDQPALTLNVYRSDRFEAESSGAGRALDYAHRFAEVAQVPGGAALSLESSIPEHAGLGSGTQLALAVGIALAKLYELPLTLQEVAAMTGRGMRSGIGIGAFEQGGLLLDGGRGANTVVPPILARMAFPEEWRVLLIFDRSGTGVHGGQELEAFSTLPEFPADTAAALCRRLLIQALPAIAERNLGQFGEAIYEIQCRVGDHFALAQGGGRYSSPAVGDALGWLHAQQVGCVGQSSWGPTGFAVLAGEEEARRVRDQLVARYANVPQLDFLICQGRNTGSDVEVYFADELLDTQWVIN